MKPMRPLSRFAALLTLATALVALAGCGTKTALKLPPPEKPAAGAAAPVTAPAAATAEKTTAERY